MRPLDLLTILVRKQTENMRYKYRTFLMEKNDPEGRIKSLLVELGSVKNRSPGAVLITSLNPCDLCQTAFQNCYGPVIAICLDCHAF